MSTESLNIVRKSKYKYVTAKKWGKSEQHENIKVGTGTNLSSVIKSNGEYFVLPFNRTGGVLAFKGVKQFGRWSPEPSELINAHKKKLSDFEFYPFSDANIIATASFDEPVKLWRLPDDPAQAKGKTEEDMFVAHLTVSSAVSRVGFHPLARNVAYTTHNESINFWDVEKQQVRLTVTEEKAPAADSISFNALGSQIVTGSKDRKIRLFDVRAQKPLIAQTDAHQSSKPFTVYWLDHSEPLLNTNGLPESNYIFSVGVSKSGDRELMLWDRRKLSMESAAPLCQQHIDQMSGSLAPFYDADNRVIFLAGKGDSSMKLYEILPEAPHCFYLNDCPLDAPLVAMCKLPKLVCDVNKHEIARFLRLTNTESVEVFSMKVPRKENIVEFFQEDIFPETWDQKPAMTANEFFDGETRMPNLISLRPAEKVSIYEIPEEQGGKRRPPRTPRSVESTPYPGELSPTPLPVEMSPEPTRFVEPAASASPSSPVAVQVQPEETKAPARQPEAPRPFWQNALGWTGFGLMYLLKALFIIFPVFVYRLFSGTRPEVHIPTPAAAAAVVPPLEDHVKQEQKQQTSQQQSPTSPTSPVSSATPTTPKTSPRAVADTKEPVDSPIEKKERTFEEKLRSGIELMRTIEVTERDLKIRPQDTDPTLKCVEIDVVNVKKGLQPILIKVRGRLKTRALIQAVSYKSLTMSDSFVLDAGKNIYHWTGPEANRIVRVAAAEVANMIRAKERGGDATLYTFDFGKDPENKIQQRQFTEFWKILGLTGTREENEKLIAAQDTKIGEDDWYKFVDGSQAIYQVNDEAQSKDERLIQVDYEGNPSKSILESTHAYIVTANNESEVYTWIGKKAKLSTRSWAIAIGRKIADAGAKKSDNELGYATFCRVIEEGEPTFFKQRFCDFPSSLMIQTAPKTVTPLNIAPKVTQQAINFKELLTARMKIFTEARTKQPELPNSTIRIWRIDSVKHDKVEYPQEMFGHFFTEDSYIVLHTFEKIAGGKKHNRLYYWQGRDCKRQEKGTNAFKTVEIASSDIIEGAAATHIRVVQSKEPISFLKLFSFRYIVHRGNYNADWNAIDGKKCLFDVRSTVCTIPEDEPATVHAVECDGVKPMYLHSYNAAILVSGIEQKSIQVWRGKFASEDEIVGSQRLAVLLAKSIGVEEGSVIQLFEGQEPAEFWEFFKNEKLPNPENFYMKLESAPDRNTKGRLYIVDDASGLLTVQDVCNYVPPATTPTPTSTTAGKAPAAPPKKIEVVKSSFSKEGSSDESEKDLAKCDTFSQEDLESEKAFILDDGNSSMLFAWIGTLCNINVKKFAFKTCLEYAQELKQSTGKEVKCYVVYEHFEPLQFEAAFHAWSELSQNAITRKKKAPTSLKLPSSSESHPTLEQVEAVDKILAVLEVSVYPYKRLLQQPLPEGVDGTKLETYLSDTEFVEVFKMSKEEFQKTPAWKQGDLKKQANLF